MEVFHAPVFKFYMVFLSNSFQPVKYPYNEKEFFNKVEFRYTLVGQAPCICIEHINNSAVDLGKSLENQICFIFERPTVDYVMFRDHFSDKQGGLHWFTRRGPRPSRIAHKGLGYIETCVTIRCHLK